MDDVGVRPRVNCSSLMEIWVGTENNNEGFFPLLCSIFKRIELIFLEPKEIYLGLYIGQEYLTCGRHHKYPCFVIMRSPGNQLLLSVAILHAKA